MLLPPPSRRSTVSSLTIKVPIELVAVKSQILCLSQWYALSYVPVNWLASIGWVAYATRGWLKMEGGGLF